MERKKPVLIVDDDPLVRRTLSDILRAKGYEPHATSSGKQALELVQRYDPIVALVDLRLGDMPGLEVIREIKACAPRSDCIVLTGFATQSSAIEAVNVGAYSYFQKPYDVEQLLITIQRAFERIDMEIHRAETIQALAESESRYQRLLNQQIAINDLTLALGDIRDMQQVYKTIYRFVREFMDVVDFIVSSYNVETKTIHAEYVVHEDLTYDVSQFPPIPLELDGRGTQSKVILTGKPQIFDDLLKVLEETQSQYAVGDEAVRILEPDNPEDMDAITKSALMVPIQVQDKIFGVLQVQSYQRNAYTTNDRDLLLGMANVAAIAIENARLLQQAHDQAQQVREIIQTVPDGVILLTPDKRVVLINPTAERMLSVLADNVSVGDALVSLADHPLTVLLNPPSEGLWHSITTSGSNPGYYEVIASAILDEGDLQGWVLVIRDVTKEREVQTRMQLNDRLAAVGQLAAGIAHDFNNIMAIILLYAQMSQNAPDISPTIRERLNIIGEQAEHATALISQILDFSRSSVLKRAPLNLQVLVKEQIRLLERTLPESIKIVTEFSGDDFMITADPTRIQQVIMNLAVNARDAMPEGGTLTLRLARLDVHEKRNVTMGVDPGAWVRIDTQDTGCGIPADILARVFDPFFTTKAPGKGTGLGLSQVHGIVKQHEGEIGVSSVVGKGTTFTIMLPALETTSHEYQSLGQESVEGNGEMILVVADNAAVREALVSTLQVLNYHTVEAENGQQALAIFNKLSDEVDAILSDLIMPDLGGKALTHLIREQMPDVPIILMSGHWVQEDTEALKDMDSIYWLHKPTTLDSIARTIAEALGKNG